MYIFGSIYFFQFKSDMVLCGVAAVVFGGLSSGQSPLEIFPDNIGILYLAFIYTLLSYFTASGEVNGININP